LDGVEGIHFCHFEDSDVVRHALVQRIVRAYESVKPGQQELPLAMNEPIGRAAQTGDQEPPGQAVYANKPQ
jgi:phosphate starvation-inducible PhoH-like protein